MKITMYELLGMVKDGKAPKKIKWEDTIYAYSDYDKDYLEFPFSDEEYKGLFNMKYSILTQFLNDEVEIIEEKKIPEKLEQITVFGATISFLRNELQDTNTRFENKINEIIDCLDYLKSKGE